MCVKVEWTWKNRKCDLWNLFFFFVVLVFNVCVNKWKFSHLIFFFHRFLFGMWWLCYTTKCQVKFLLYKIIKKWKISLFSFRFSFISSLILLLLKFIINWAHAIKYEVVVSSNFLHSNSRNNIFMISEQISSAKALYVIFLIFSQLLFSVFSICMCSVIVQKQQKIYTLIWLLNIAINQAFVFHFSAKPFHFFSRG